MDVDEVKKAYRLYFPVIEAKCGRILRHPAEAQDLAQETFTKLWERRGRILDPEDSLRWIYRTAMNLAIDRIRRNATINTAFFEPLGTVPGIDGQVSARQEIKQLAKHLRRREWQAVVLSRVDGLRHDQIAQVMDVSDRTVRRLLQNAETKLSNLKEKTV